MSRPEISICLITYNHGNFVRKTLESIIEQVKAFSWELIIADDCSTDNTREIIQEYKLRFPEEIRLIFQRENVGPFRNWMDLLQSAKGKYISYIEGDDYWLDPLKLKKQYEFLEDNLSYIACCGNSLYVRNEKEMEPVRNWKKSRDIVTKDFLFGNDLLSATIFFRNNLPENLPHLFKNVYAGDWMLYYILSKKGKFYYMPEIFAAYRVHSNGLWSHLNYIEQVKRERDMKQILLKDNIINKNFLVLSSEIIRLNRLLLVSKVKLIAKKILRRKNSK